MTTITPLRLRPFLFGTATVLTMALTVPAIAQDANMSRRVTKLEKEMQAVQREVFPGGDARFFEGEIGSAPTSTPAPSRTTTPIADLTARVDALEGQLRTLTEQSEQNAFRLKALEQQFAAFKASATPSPEPAALAPSTPATPATTTAPPRAANATPRSEAAPAASKPSADRIAQVKAVEVPNTGDEVEDAYTYGFRLWQAKLYPEAQTQLKKVADTWPKHSRASYAQNLLGRAYLDDNKPSFATVAFYNNYKDRPQGDRAPHSLLYMGISLDKLGRKADACKAYKELDDVYGDKAPADVRRDAAAARARSGC